MVVVSLQGLVGEGQLRGCGGGAAGCRVWVLGTGFGVPARLSFFLYVCSSFPDTPFPPSPLLSSPLPSSSLPGPTTTQAPLQHLAICNTIPVDRSDLIFISAFEGGNLLSAQRVGPHEYDLLVSRRVCLCGERETERKKGVRETVGVCPSLLVALFLLTLSGDVLRPVLLGGNHAPSEPLNLSSSCSSCCYPFSSCRWIGAAAVSTDTGPRCACVRMRAADTG